MDMPIVYFNTLDLQRALLDAEKAHAAYEEKIGRKETNWPAFYAEYMQRTQTEARVAAQG